MSYEGFCDKCGKVVKMNMQGNTDTHDCTPMSNKLTPEALIEQLANDLFPPFLLSDGRDAMLSNRNIVKLSIRKALENPELLQAQELYTKEEVRQMIADAFDAGHDRTLPGKHYAERLLPSQPKTTTNE